VNFNVPKMRFLVVSIILYANPFEIHSSERQQGKILGSGTSLAKVTLENPKGGWTVDRMIEVSGTVSDPTVNPITVNINGDRYLLRTHNGSFKRKFPMSAGKNSIIVQATNKAGLSQAERSIFAQISPLAMMLVQTSDTDGVYTDLHVYEPDPNSKDPFEEAKSKNVHVYWADTASPSGGKFYLNSQGDDFDQPGFGPYLYTHTSPPLGIYRIDANYWPSGDKAHTVATLNVVLFAGTPQELRKTVQFPLVMPGETVTLLWIRLDKGQKASLWAPLMDAQIPNAEIWPEWVKKFVVRRKGSEE